MWNFVFFCQKADHGCVFICLFVFFFVFFPRGDRIDPVVLECRERAHSKINEKF